MSKKIPSKDLHFKLQDWINKTLGKPNPIFNNLPACPYAKQAWVSDKVEVRQFQSWVDAYTDLLVNDFDFEKYEVVIFAFIFVNGSEILSIGLLLKDLSPFKIELNF